MSRLNVARRMAVTMACMGVLAAWSLSARAGDHYAMKTDPAGGPQWQAEVKGILERLGELSKDPDAHGQEVVTLIGRLPEYDANNEGLALRAIIERSKDQDVLEQACKRLGRLAEGRGDSRRDAIQFFQEALRHPNPVLRGWGAEALGRCRDLHSVGKLVALLDDPDRRVVKQARDSICFYILNWREPEMDPEGKWIEPFKARCKPVVDALAALEAAVQQGKATHPPKD